jgi:Protein of unknown function (DUF3592)
VFITYAGSLIFGLIVFLADLFVGISLVVNVTGALALAARGVETVGQVTRVEPRRAGGSAHVLVGYDTPGGRFQAEGTVGRALLGDRVPVRYDPDKPASATTLLRPWRRTFVGIPTVLVLMAMSIGMITGAAWYFRGTHTSLQLPLAGGSTLGVLAVVSCYGAAIQYAALWRWRRRIQVVGKALRYEEKSPVGPGILVSFESADGPEEFWAQAGTVDIGSGDEVTVYYEPDRPATSATIRDAYGVRSTAIWWTFFALGLGALAIFSLTQL